MGNAPKHPNEAARKDAEDDSSSSLSSSLHTQESGGRNAPAVPDAVESLEGSQDRHNTTQRHRSRQPNPIQQDDASEPSEDEPQDLEAPANLRRSKRKRKEVRHFLNQNLVGRKDQFISFEFDKRGGIDQPGRNYYRDEEEIRRREDEESGKEIFKYYLEPAGWKCQKNWSLNSTYVILRGSIKTAKHGITRFDTYEELWRKWKSDKRFRRAYKDNNEEISVFPEREKIFSPERFGRDYPQDCEDENYKKPSSRNWSKGPRKGPKKAAKSSNPAGMFLDGSESDEKAEEGTPQSTTRLVDRLGEPTPGVPAAAAAPLINRPEERKKPPKYKIQQAIGASTIPKKPRKRSRSLSIPSEERISHPPDPRPPKRHKRKRSRHPPIPPPPPPEEEEEEEEDVPVQEEPQPIHRAHDRSRRRRGDFPEAPSIEVSASEPSRGMVISPNAQRLSSQELRDRLEAEELEIAMLEKQIQKEKLKKELARLQRENDNR